jgi:hypothetical protein
MASIPQVAAAVVVAGLGLGLVSLYIDGRVSAQGLLLIVFFLAVVTAMVATAVRRR